MDKITIDFIWICGVLFFVGMFFILCFLSLKHAENKLKSSRKELAETLRVYVIMLRIYRDILKMRKEKGEDISEMPM